jgi:uncharacterized cupredoxin-like copper-binding protein
MSTSRMAAGALGTLLAAASATAVARAPGDPAPLSAPAAASGRISLTLNEYAITRAAVSARAGRVKLTVHNRGKRVHEMLVVKADGTVPLKGGRVDEAKLERQHRVIGEISDVAPGRTRAKTFALRSGAYLLFCNLPGHYAAGMRATLVVRAPHA